MSKSKGPVDINTTQRNLRHVRDSDLAPVRNFQCVNMGYRLPLYPAKECFDEIHEYRVARYGEFMDPQKGDAAVKNDTLRLKIAMGQQVTTAPYKWGTKGKPPQWKNSTMELKKKLYVRPWNT